MIKWVVKTQCWHNHDTCSNRAEAICVDARCKPTPHCLAVWQMLSIKLSRVGGVIPHTLAPTLQICGSQPHLQNPTKSSYHGHATVPALSWDATPSPTTTAAAASQCTIALHLENQTVTTTKDAHTLKPTPNLDQERFKTVTIIHICWHLTT